MYNAAIEAAIDNDNMRQRLQHEKFKMRDKIEREKQGSHWRHVIRNLQRGGWGKKAVGGEAPRHEDFEVEQRRNDDGPTTDREGGDHVLWLRGCEAIDAVCQDEYDLWEWNIGVSAQDIDEIAHAAETDS